MKGFTPTSDIETATVCYVHPTVETALRCNKCGQYICARCAVRTPVGYRCKQCVRQQQDVYFSARPTDYVIAAAVGLVLGGPIGFVLGKMLLLALLLSLPAGGLISEAAFRATGKRRGRYTGYVIAAGIVLGTLIANYELMSVWLSAPGDIPLLTFAGPGLYIVLCAGAAAARFRFGK
ncbi:MAG: hypothetical protein ACYDBJ_28170 [Aggregatilineales bacterium]